ncbi:MAG: Ig-like domain-containing protein [Clostridia bacterium]
MTQAAATSESVIVAALKATAEAAVNNNSIAITINKVSYTAPVAGDANNPSGTDGSYTFAVTVAKGSQSQTTGQKTITITATTFKKYVPPSTPYYSVEDVSLDKPELTLTAGGETAVLHATVRPTYATYTSVTWSSSDPKVATVDSDGVVTPLSPGTTTITVTTADQAKTATSKVKVVEAAKLIRLKASEKAVLLQPNKSVSITVYAIYSNGTEEDITEDRAVKYSTSSKTKATVTAGVIKAGKKEGTATITITYRGQKVKIPVRISKLQVTEVELQPSTLKVAVEQEKQLQLTATLSNKKTEDVTELATWSSSDPAVATIDENGKLTAIAQGTSIIIAKYGGKSSEMTVEVSEAKQVKRLTVSKRNVTVSVGKEQSIKLTAYFKDNSKEIVTEQASWSSEDDMIVSVKNGVISGKAPGTVNIQATYQGKIATITVTVTK